MRISLRLAAVAALTVVGAAGLIGPAHAHGRPTLPTVVDLPVGFRPEGIAIGGKPVAYVGSLADGDIYAANLETGQGRVVVQGPGTPSVGLKLDGDRRLFVAGGPTGTGRLVDLRSGVTVSYAFTTSTTTFVNDVVLTKQRAWFTDSMQAQLYSVARSGRASSVRTLPLTGDWEQTPGVNNANGISTTPNKKSLLVVQTNTGLLFRVNPTTGVARTVDLGGYVLINGDGLLRQGRILYVVQNRSNQVAVLRLNQAGTQGRLVKTLTSPDFAVPTTIAAYQQGLYLPNAKFGDPAPATATYSITRISR